MIDSRLKLAREHGSVPIDARQGDVGQRIKDMTGGRGADSAMEAVGTEAALASTFNMIRPKGTISVVGVFVEAAATLPISQAFFGEFNIRFGLGDSARYRDEMFELVRTGRLQPERIITHRMKLEEAPSAYKMFDQREAFKVVLAP
jgi:threonine dehydrogenase-like Zn-dependent dehydrogenase